MIGITSNHTQIQTQQVTLPARSENDIFNTGLCGLNTGVCPLNLVHAELIHEQVWHFNTLSLSEATY